MKLKKVGAKEIMEEKGIEKPKHTGRVLREAGG